jgi:tight adherence protein B
VLALSSFLVFLTTFLAAGLAVLIGWFALQRMGAEALVEDFSERLLDDSPRLLKDETFSTISLWAKLLERWDFTRIMHGHLLQAGLAWSVGRTTLLMLLAGSVAIGIEMQLDWIPGWAMLPFGAAVAALPYAYIRRRRAKRFRQFEENFPEALDSLSRSLRAGHPFASALEIVAEECEPPVSTELRQTAVEGSLGTSWEQALNNLSERMPLLEVSLFAAAVQLQNRTGGKLNEVLQKLSEDMRESVALKGEVRALAAHGKLTGAVLTVLPIAIAGVMMMVSPSYLVVLFHYPNGKYLIAASVVCLIVGHFAIRRLVDIRL